MAASSSKTHPRPAVEETAAALPLKTAAAKMGISESTLRGRIKRGVVRSCKDGNGRLLVFLDEPGNTAATAPTSETASPLADLVGALRELHEGIASQNAAMDRLMDLHGRQFDSNTQVETQLRDMTHRLDTLHTAVKTMGAAFRIHAQETDRLIKSLNRAAGQTASDVSTVPPQSGFAPPGQKQRLFGRRHSDYDDTTDESS